MAKSTKNTTVATSGVSLGLAVKNRDFDMISSVVANAVKIVTDAAIVATGVAVAAGNAEASAVVAVIAAPQPAVPSIETVHGFLPLTAIFDEETVWEKIEAEYAELTQKVGKLPEEGKALAISKLIVANPVLRNCSEAAAPAVDGLI